MKTIKDIIDMVGKFSCCHFSKSREVDMLCYKCELYKYCGVDTKILTLDYLYRGEYYG
jgi:hypothetical protein